MQRVWRRHSATKMVSLQLQHQWLEMMNTHPVPLTKTQISSNVLRPFLFFVASSSNRYKRIEAKDADCMRHCLGVVLKSINSSSMAFFFFSNDHFLIRSTNIKNFIRSVWCTSSSFYLFFIRGFYLLL